MTNSKARRQPFWLITKQDNGRMDVLTMSRDGGEVLPIFCFEDEAEVYLRIETPGACWRARETTVGELVSLLYGPCADVEKVALDPLPAMDGEEIMDLAQRGRKRFIESLLFSETLTGRYVLPLHPGLSANPAEDGQQTGYARSGIARGEDGQAHLDHATSHSGSSAAPHSLF